MTPMQRTYAIAQQDRDARKDVIRQMREKIEELCVERVELREQMRHMVSLDDPVVTGLVEALRNFEQTCYSRDNYLQAHKALSAYEARVKTIEPTIQNHGHINIDYKYNNETTTMSPARVKEVGK